MISKKHECVFVHVPKTGGTSIEHAFLADLGLAWDERGAVLMGPNRDPALGPPRLGHLTAEEYYRNGHISRETFDGYFSFGFVRNPWSRVVSFYKYLGVGGEFKRFVCASLPGTLWKRDHYFVKPQHEFLCDASGKVIVDFVGRFETIAADFAKVAERVGLPQALPHKNKQDRGSRFPSVRARARQLAHGVGEGDFGHVRAALRAKQAIPRDGTLFDEESAAVIRALYGRDMELFGYPDAPDRR